MQASEKWAADQGVAESLRHAPWFVLIGQKSDGSNREHKTYYLPQSELTHLAISPMDTMPFRLEVRPQRVAMTRPAIGSRVTLLEPLVYTGQDFAAYFSGFSKHLQMWEPVDALRKLYPKD